jgi:hypothetical protein
MPKDSFELRIEACAKGNTHVARNLSQVFATNDRICPFSMYFEIKENENKTTKQDSPTTICEKAGEERTAKKLDDFQTTLHYRPCTLYRWD